MSAIELGAEQSSSEASTTHFCPSCGSSRLEVFHEQVDVPVHSCRLVSTREEALAFPRGTLRLALCRECAFITNVAYEADLQDYGVHYEETQGFSPTFRRFSRSLADRWIERYDLRDRDILEIGCGKGEFLALVCEVGRNRGVGIDPAFVAERLETPAAERLRFITDLFDQRYVDLEADAIVCRHTLEHIAPVAEFVSLIRTTSARRPGSVVLFDLPDVVRVLREAAFWDIYYEHCSYFSPGSLARLFRRAGFRVLDLQRAYDDQYLVLEATPGRDDTRWGLEETVDELVDEVAAFRGELLRAVEGWRDVLRRARADGKRVAIWGAGSKGVSFLHVLAAGDCVAYAIDINPFKQGMHLAGSGHLVCSPDDLCAAPPDLIVLMNPSYVDEVRAQLHVLDLTPEILVA